MGTLSPFDEDEPFEEKVKCLADEELLEIWAESQQMENLLNSQSSDSFFLDPSYEKTILMELYLRAGRKLISTPRA